MRAAEIAKMADCCNGEVTTDNVFMCDGCGSTKHLLCDGVNKNEAVARKKSARLLLYCTGCNGDRDNIMTQSITTIKQFVLKFDATAQMNKAEITNIHNLLTTVSKNLNEKFEKLSDKVAVAATTENRANGVSTNAQSYAAVAKKNRNVFIVRPKQSNAETKTTRDKVKKNVNPVVSGVVSMENISNGGVVVVCNSEENMNKLKAATEKKLGNEFTVDFAKKRMPKIKIVGMSEKLSNEDICESIRGQNHWVGENVFKIVNVYSVKDKYYSAILEVDAQMFEACMREKYITVGWESCKVYEHVNVLMCLKCCGYNHKAKDCNGKEACGRCSGSHKTAECTSQAEKCINCVLANKKFNMKLDVNHHVSSSECKVRKRKIDIAKQHVMCKQ